MKLIIANWKSHKTREDVQKWIEVFEEKSDQLPTGIEVAIAPPMPSLMFVSNRLLAKDKHSQTKLAVQDLSPFPAGAYTGAVSTTNLVGFGVKYAIVGHSERRRYFHETHQDVANKVAQAIDNNITPIVCVDDEYIADQAAAIDRQYLDKCMVAYEELGAIGTGHSESV
ncbi:MAG TPA: triose-phosphate isomerase family protein, partial [Patescibacteria group bacterium]